MRNPKARVLVVEDDDAILQGLLDVLVFNGFLADGTADGGEGLRRALAGGYDLVLLDVMLPTLDGFAVCRKLRRARPGQAIILLTAKGAEEDVVTGFKAGADGYVVKPFSLRELLVRVEAVLRRSGKSLGDERIQAGAMVFDGRSLKAVRDGRTEPSPLAAVPREPYILGYLQNNPDGSMQTPLAADPARAPGRYPGVVDQLREANHLFNRKKYSLPAASQAPQPATAKAEPPHRRQGPDLPPGDGARFAGLPRPSWPGPISSPTP